jgi:hypothetical protein
MGTSFIISSHHTPSLSSSPQPDGTKDAPVLSLIPLLVGCAFLTRQDVDERLDPDNDKVLWPDDCDDNDASIGQESLWYADTDGDGYGGGETLPSCSQPEGYLALGGDCDDDNASINPGAQEVCDDADIDEDCSGSADDSDTGADASTMSEWYVDDDGDGHGTGAAVMACDAPAGHVANSTDCNDSSAAASPDFAEEVCGDGVDNDCDGADMLAEACGLSGEIPLAGILWKMVGESSGDRAGWSVSSAGDVNGDGRADMLIGANGSSSGGADSGAAYLVLGPITAGMSLATADATFLGEEAGDNAGQSVAAAGDTNNDGYDDFLIGADKSDRSGEGAGAAYLILGPISGSRSLASTIALLGANAGDNAGYGIAPLGDVDADGSDDILVGASLAEPDGSMTGAVYLLHGPITADLSLSEADAILSGAIGSELAGWSTDGAGDVDGDGATDILVGAYKNSTNGTEAGVSYLVLGPVTADGSLADSDAVFIGEAAGDRSGHSVRGAGDVNNDGRADLLISAYEHGDGGAVYLILGPVTGSMSLAAADAKLIAGEEDSSTGWSIDGAGDVNADGSDDIIVGANASGRGGSNSGAAYLFWGPVSGNITMSDASAQLIGDGSGQRAGGSVAGAGDVDGDGDFDVLIGAHSDGDAGTSAGSAYLLLGGPGL